MKQENEANKNRSKYLIMKHGNEAKQEAEAKIKY